MMMTSMDFSFAFNSVQFSDRTLRIVILPDAHTPPGSGSQASTPRKQLRLHVDDEHDELQNSGNAHDSSMKNNSSSQMEHFQEKNVPVSSVLLAAQSPFFHNLFSNGMRESGEQHVTIHIQASEEAAFMDLLKYMYTSSLSGTTPSELLDVLITADKFTVASCVELCRQSLLSLPMTLESALLYLDRTLTDSVISLVKPLLEAAEEFVAKCFKYISKDDGWNELLALPLVGVIAVLKTDCLVIYSEDDIYDFILQWVKTHYSGRLVEGRCILNMLLRKYLHFHLLTAEKLKSVLTCSDLDPAIISELAIGALRYFKSHPPTEQVPARSYMRLNVKAVSFGDSSSHPQCIVYLHLRRDACGAMFPNGDIHSESFFAGERELYIVATCSVSPNDSSPCFGMFVCPYIRVPKTEPGYSISFEFATWDESREDFVRKFKAELPATYGNDELGCHDLFGVPWTTFINGDSPYFVDGILRVRCTIRVENFE